MGEEDLVRPRRYALPHNLDVIDIVLYLSEEDLWTGGEAFMLGNVLKYVIRSGVNMDSETRLRDWKKARAYLDRLITTTEAKSIARLSDEGT